MSGAAGTGLSARNLHFRRDGREILADVSIDVPPGTFTGLLGANGSGKTTLLRLLLGLIEPARGMVCLEETPLKSLPRRAIATRIGYVPQAHVAAFPFTVTEVVAMGRAPWRGRGWAGSRSGAADGKAVAHALERLGLTGLGRRSYAGLSGGERQSVLIARALAQGARTLLLDEPTASLDIGQQTRVMQLLHGLTKEGYAVLMSVHQPEAVLRWCGRAAFLEQGRIIAHGATADVVTAERLSRLYGVDLRIIRTEGRDFLLT